MRQTFKEVWDATEVQVASPNEQVFLTIHGNRQVTVTILAGYVERTSSALVHEQLVRVARLALSARTKEFFGLRSRREGRLVRPKRELRTPADSEYARRLAKLSVEGLSADGTVRLFSEGLTHFTVDFPRAISSEALADRLGEAATALLHDQMARAFDLKLETHSGRVTGHE